MNFVHAGLVQELVRFLSQNPLSVEDIAAFVGPVTHDPGVPLPIELQPVLTGVRSARLARYPDSGLPYLLTLEFATESQPTLAGLRAVLGDYRRALTGRGMPPELVFFPHVEGKHWQIAVITRLSTHDVEAAPITSLSFRRDPVNR